MNESPNAMLERANDVAVIAHAGQVDKIGEAYIPHPLRVMLAVKERGGRPQQQAAAALHDVLEDCDVSEDFLEHRFPPGVYEMVDALTHQNGEAYEDFLRRVAKTPRALLIKEADILDNHGRLHHVQDEAIRRRLQAKYDSALELIRELRRSTAER